MITLLSTLPCTWPILHAMKWRKKTSLIKKKKKMVSLIIVTHTCISLCRKYKKNLQFTIHIIFIVSCIDIMERREKKEIWACQGQKRNSRLSSGSEFTSTGRLTRIYRLLPVADPRGGGGATARRPPPPPQLDIFIYLFIYLFIQDFFQ